MPVTKVSMIIFLVINNPPANSAFSVLHPTKSAAPTPNRIVLSKLQSANQWIYVTNSRWCLNEDGLNQPMERLGKIGN